MASTFPVTLDAWGTVTDSVDTVSASHVNDLRDAVEKIEDKVGIDNSAVTDTLDYLIRAFLSTGRKMWIYENSAPTGWTALAAIIDRVLAIKGGSEAYNVNGGSQAGDGWEISGITHAHTHASVTSSGNNLGYVDQAGGYNNCAIWGHTHDLGGDPADDTVVSSDGTYRPDAGVGILISKN